MTIPEETLAWLRQSAATDGAAYSQVLLHLLERLEALEAAQQHPADHFADANKMVLTPEAAPLSDALITAESALSDIAEGEETNASPNAHIEWAEQRCVKALDTIRPVMRDHGIRTSEWPPVAHPAPPVVAIRAALERLVKLRNTDAHALLGSDWHEAFVAARVALDQPPAPQPTPPAALAGGLVERVAAAIDCAPSMKLEDEARAAILEVAEWLSGRGQHASSLWLREEADR